MYLALGWPFSTLYLEQAQWRCTQSLQALRQVLALGTLLYKTYQPEKQIFSFLSSFIFTFTLTLKNGDLIKSAQKNILGRKNAS